MVQLPQLKAADAWWALVGVHLTLDGDSTTKVQYLLDITQQWQMEMVKAKLAHLAAEFSMHKSSSVN